MWKLVTSLRCLDIKSSNWLTRKLGGKAGTPPLGIVINSLHIGHRKAPASLVCEAAILVRQCKQTLKIKKVKNVWVNELIKIETKV